MSNINVSEIADTISKNLDTLLTQELDVILENVTPDQKVILKDITFLLKNHFEKFNVQVIQNVSDQLQWDQFIIR